MTLIPHDRTSTPAMRQSFYWTTQDGLTVRPHNMQTSHIFNCIVMLWHHFMPTEAILYPHKRYRMGSRFTAEFIETALRVLLPELAARDDLTVFQLQSLEKIAVYLRKKPNQLPTPEWHL
ncbi:hypothetical protein N9Y00_07115 [Tateyamaria sp.]|nr:hypothetical protein [Tateyamaria sp.]